MKKILPLVVFVLLTSCLTEKNATPGKPNTFVRYFNGGYNDNAVVAEETSDQGVIILGTSTVSLVDGNATVETNKIKLIKTDPYGNVEWQKVYPAEFTPTAKNIKAHSLIQLSTGISTSGYTIIGEQITGTGTNQVTDLYVLQVDANGEIVKETVVDFSGASVNLYTKDDPKPPFTQGQAIQLNSNGNFLVLVSTSGSKDNMILAELDKSDYSPKWAKKYGAGSSTLSNRLFLDASNYVFWSGTVTRSSEDVRLVKAGQNSLNTLFDLPIGTPNFQETGNDICRYGFGFAVVGNTNETLAGDQDILFKVLADDGSELLSKSFGFSDTDNGNSICSAKGGVVILGTSRSVPAESGGRGDDDYYLMKFDAFGNEAWPSPRIFGSKNKDAGASVRQLSDGSLLILGTTDFGGLKTMMLMKADADGNIE